MKGVYLLIFALLLTSCTDESGATRTLSGAGYTDISVGGYDFFACGKGDNYATKFTATGPSGQRVEGAVCSGLLFKNSTIRFN